MVEHELDTANSILYVRPKGALATDDFATLASTVDPHIEATGGLAGIVIETCSWPGWEGLGAIGGSLPLRAGSSPACPESCRRDRLGSRKYGRAPGLTLRVRRDQALSGGAGRGSEAVD